MKRKAWLSNMSKKVVIIGGGASGLMAAIMAACQGACVTLVEHKDRVGKKILMTGNGRCNLTNMSDLRGKYYGNDSKRIYEILEKFTAEDTRAFFRHIGLYTKEKRDGGVYPVSEQAVSVLDALVTEAKYCGVQILTDTEVLDVIPESNGGTVLLETTIKEKVSETKGKKGNANKKSGPKMVAIGTKKNKLHYDSLIIATGGQAAAVSGSDGSGYRLAKKLGHSIIKPLPALVQLKCEGDYFRIVAGVRAQASLTLFVDGKEEAKEEGELQFTDYGISGIPVFQFSRIVSRAIYEQQVGLRTIKTDSVVVVIDYLTYLSQTDIDELVKTRESFAHKTVEEFFGGLVNKKLAMLVCHIYKWNVDTIMGNLSDEEFMACFKLLKNFKVVVSGTNSYDSAQVCSGGIPLEEIGDTMESRKCPHIFFAGEILDCDGICGGYNLQWAWTTGKIAGEYAAINKGNYEGTE